MLLSQLIDSSADRNPDQIAYRGVSDAINYGDLANQTSRLANLLIAEGLKKGDRVGVFLPRCVESALAVHGILKSGGVFVPIDPQSSLIRLSQLIEDCQIRFLVTGHSQTSKISSLLGVPGHHCTSELECVIGLPDEHTATFGEELKKAIRFHSFDSLTKHSSSLPDVDINQDDLAYIMYTSGSTGKPKGIMHTHYSGCQYAELSAKTYGIGPSDSIGNHSPLHFDMSTLGYLTSPFAGATTVIIPAAYTKFPASLSELIESAGITIWYSVPLALIQLLLRGAIEKRDLSKLRWVLFGGEPFPPKHLWALVRELPHVRFSNVYGPAEVNQCTYYHLPAAADSSFEFGQVPIGKIWERTEKLIVEDDEPVQPGQVGELLVSTTTMMKGYWGRADLDQHAFFFQEQANGKKERFYRTGDLVRENSSGEMEFLGRNDRQIKLRGHRIELDHIESVLTSHPEVQEAGVYPISDQEEIVGIGAAVLPQNSELKLAEEAVRSFALEHLPGYSVPSEIIVMNQLPRTGSGKIDRRELQEQGTS